MIGPPSLKFYGLEFLGMGDPPPIILWASPIIDGEAPPSPLE